MTVPPCEDAVAFMNRSATASEVANKQVRIVGRHQAR